MITSTASRMGALAGLVLMLAGCAGSQQHIARAAIEAHLAQEQTANQMLLLNLVRANLGYPLHFSRIDSMNLVAGDATPTLGLSLGFLAADSNPGRALTIGATGTRPTLEVTPQDSKEFVQGLTTALGVDWMAYFVNQGWDMSLVVNLLIERVEKLVEPQTVPPTYEPDREAISTLEGCKGIELVPVPGEPYGPVVLATDLPGKVSIIEARKAGLSISTVDGGFQLLEPSSVVTVKFLCNDTPQPVRANNPASAWGARSAESSPPPPALQSAEQRRIVMRSAARMIRYLGSTATVRGLAKDAPLGKIQWRVGEPAAVADAAVSVVYAGKAYWIAHADTNTMKTLALMNHVLLLKGSTSEVPPTQTVRVRVTPR